MSFYSIYAILSQIRFCRDLRFFCVNFWGQKLRLRNFFDKYDVWLDTITKYRNKISCQEEKLRTHTCLNDPLHIFSHHRKEYQIFCLLLRCAKHDICEAIEVLNLLSLWPLTTEDSCWHELPVKAPTVKDTPILMIVLVFILLKVSFLLHPHRSIFPPRLDSNIFQTRKHRQKWTDLHRAQLLPNLTSREHFVEVSFHNDLLREVIKKTVFLRSGWL